MSLVESVTQHLDALLEQADNQMHKHDPEWHDHVKYFGSKEKAAFSYGWQHTNRKVKGYHTGKEPTPSHLGNLKKHYVAGKKMAAAKAKESGDADSGMHNSFDNHMSGAK